MNGTRDPIYGLDGFLRLRRLALAAAVVAVALAVSGWSSQALAAGDACRADTVELKGDWGLARFAVEVVDTPESRARGLMFRESMASRAGMLFVFDEPGPVSFWMKNTLIPLDMIFAGPDGRVRTVHHDAIPGDTTSIPGGDGVQFVLEINAGLARRYGIGSGDLMRHPSIPAETAAWPCGTD